MTDPIPSTCRRCGQVPAEGEDHDFPALAATERRRFCITAACDDIPAVDWYARTRELDTLLARERQHVETMATTWEPKAISAEREAGLRAEVATWEDRARRVDAKLASTEAELVGLREAVRATVGEPDFLLDTAALGARVIEEAREAARTEARDELREQLDAQVMACVEGARGERDFWKDPPPDADAPWQGRLFLAIDKALGRITAAHAAAIEAAREEGRAEERLRADVAYGALSTAIAERNEARRERDEAGKRALEEAAAALDCGDVYVEAGRGWPVETNGHVAAWLRSRAEKIGG